MKLNRIKLQELIKWKDSKDRKPIIVWGARQVGKSYLVKDLFAKEYFKNYLYIDLKKDEETLNYFKTTSDPDKYITYIETKFNRKIDQNCLLIIDEVQLCHNVISSLKYFYQDHKELPIIVTGSMVRLSLYNDSKDEGLFPVGKVHSIDLYPLNFEEYLNNANNNLYKKICESYKSMTPLENPLHKLAYDYLHEYLSIGGMPEVVKKFLETKSYYDVKEVIEDIYKDYINDMSTYNVSLPMVMKTKNIYENIFVQLNKENKNFKINLIDRNKSNRDYFDAYNWLELSKVVYKSNILTDKITIPLIANKSLFRLYLFDSGLFVHQSKSPLINFFDNNERNELSGVFYENYFAIELVSNDIPLFYWKGKNDNEFEFVVQSGNDIIPIDVKKGRNKMNSLDNFKTFNKLSLALKLMGGNLGLDKSKKILTLPLYMAFLAIKDIKNGTIVGKL